MVENEKSSTCLTTCIYYICIIIKSISGRRVDETVENPEFLYISGGNVVQPLWKRIWKFTKKVNRVIAWLSNSTPRYKPKRPENICPHFQTDVQSSIIHYSKMWNQQASPSVGQRIDKQNVIYPQKRIGNERNELLTHAVAWILKTLC